MEDVSVRVDKLGRILLPVSVRRAAGFEPNARLMVRVHEGRVELMTLAAAVRAAQTLVRARVPGRRRQAALTADRAWLGLDVGVRIVAIR